MSRRYRFFFHYNKHKKMMSVHFRKHCILVDDVVCNTRCNTKWSKIQPHLRMEGFTTDVRIDKINNIAIIL